MTLMGTGQFKHPVNSVIEGILSGITDMSQEGHLTINLLMSNINQDELVKVLEKREERDQPGPSQPSAPLWNVPAGETNTKQGETEFEDESELSEFEYDSDSSDSSLFSVDSDSSETQNIYKDSRLRNKRGGQMELNRVTDQIGNDWPEVRVKGISFKNPTSDKRGRTLTKNWNKKIVNARSLTYGQMRSASRSQ